MSSRRKKGRSVTEKQMAFVRSVYDALRGVVSEMGPDFFDSYHRDGGERMMNDFEELLIDVYPESFVDEVMDSYSFGEDEGGEP